MFQRRLRSVIVAWTLMSLTCLAIVGWTHSYPIYMLVGALWALGIISGIELLMRPDEPMVQVQRAPLTPATEQYYRHLASYDHANAAYYLALLHLQSVGVEFEQSDVWP